MTSPHKNTSGDVAAVPCPHCGKVNDLRGFRDMALLDTGAKVTCDHCNRNSHIVGIAPTVIVVWGTSTGHLTAVKCPACGTHQDMTELRDMGVLEKGNTVTCDRCDKHAPIHNVTPRTNVTLAPRR